MRSLLALLLFSGPSFAQDWAATCVCDYTSHSFPGRNCGLSEIVDKAPADLMVVFVKDNSLNKPNRWLALPRRPTSGKPQTLGDITPAERAELFRQAIVRARELWGERWGLAMNGIRSRGQCQTHVHIGRLLDGVEWGDFKEISSPEEIPDPGDLGLWIHPVANGKMHVHVEMVTESVLAR